MLKILIVFLTLGFSTAQAIALKEVEIVNAAYFPEDRVIGVLVAYKGACADDVHGLRINNCTEVVPHSICAATLLVGGEKECSNEVEQKVLIIPREHIVYQNENIDTNKFENTRIIINGKTTKKEVQLRKN